MIKTKDEEFFVCLNIDRLEIAWAVYAGRMDSAGSFGDPNYRPLSYYPYNLFFKASQGCRISKTRIEKELRLEQIRRQHYPDKVSRLHGIYLWQSKDDAKRAAKWASEESHFRDDLITSVGFGYWSKSIYDTQWIDRNIIFNGDALIFDDTEWMHRYFRGEPMDENPHWEVIAEGRGIIWGTENRNRAMNFIETHYRESLPLAEVARIAVLMNDDTHLMAPHAIRLGSILKGDMFMREQSLRFKEEVSDFVSQIPKCEINIKAFEGLDEFLGPNLLSRSFRFDLETIDSRFLADIDNFLTVPTTLTWELFDDPKYKK